VTVSISPGSSSTPPFDQRRWWPWIVAGAAAWVALVQAALWWFARYPARRTLWGDERIYLSSAIRLATGDPTWWPESLWPPLYPQFLAGVMWIGGRSMATIIIAQGTLLAIAAILLFDLTSRLTESRAAGVAAAVLTLGYPPLASFSYYLWPEILHFFLFAALLWILATRVQRPVWCAIAGLVLGLALLSKSLLLPFVPVLLVAGVWGIPPKRAVSAIVLLTGMATATVALVLIGSVERTARPLISNSATFNLWVGLNDVGRENFRHDVVWSEFQRWRASADDHAERDRFLRSRIRGLVRERGLPAVLRGQLCKQYFRLFDAGCYFTDQLPGGAAFERAGAGYLEVGHRVALVATAVTVVMIVLMWGAATTGLMVGGCRGKKWVRMLVLFLAYNLALFFWLHVTTRYRIQMLPAAFVGVGCLVAWLEAGCCPRPSKLRAAATVGVVGLLTWLALG